jgi:hypothetical protein
MRQAMLILKMFNEMLQRNAFGLCEAHKMIKMLIVQGGSKSFTLQKYTEKSG